MQDQSQTQGELWKEICKSLDQSRCRPQAQQWTTDRIRQVLPDIQAATMTETKLMRIAGPSLKRAIVYESGSDTSYIVPWQEICDSLNTGIAVKLY